MTEMTYDFDTIQDRKNTNSLKWDVRQNELPMWVADMDFQTAPVVIKALEERVKRGIFGYNIVPDAWYEAIKSWWKRRHDFKIEKEWLTFCTGVVPAISCAVKRLTNIGDNVLVLTPVYDIFFHSIENGGRHVLESQLKYVDGCYEIDFEDLEEKLSHPLTTMMILCNPHNPVGKIWTAEELEKIGELCKKHHVIVLSDEIHCDLTAPGKGYIPFASLSETCKMVSISCISATKAFNFAGLQTAAVITPEEGLRNKMVRGLNSDEIAEPNSFATDAVIAAFNEGEEWLEELRTYLYQNKQYAASFIQQELPQLKIVLSEATYLLWVDCAAVTDNTEELCTFLEEHAGLRLSAGTQYRGNGKGFVRINLACPRSQVEEGMRRFSQGLTDYEKWIEEKNR